MILHATDRVHRGLCLAGQVCFWIPLTPRVALPGSVKCHRPQIAKFPAYLSSSAADLSTVLGLVAGLHLRRPTHRTWAPFSEASCLPGQWSSSSAPPPPYPCCLPVHPVASGPGPATLCPDHWSEGARTHGAPTLTSGVSVAEVVRWCLQLGGFSGAEELFIM